MRYWYPTYGHPDGPDSDPRYAVDLASGLVYPAAGNSFGPNPAFRMVRRDVFPVDANVRTDPPWFEVRGTCVHVAPGHPGVPMFGPWYQMR